MESEERGAKSDNVDNVRAVEMFDSALPFILSRSE